MTSKDKNNEVFCSQIKLDEQNKLCRVEAICFRTLKKLKKQLLDSTQLITPIIQEDSGLSKRLILLYLYGYELMILIAKTWLSLFEGKSFLFKIEETGKKKETT